MNKTPVAALPIGSSPEWKVAKLSHIIDFKNKKINNRTRLVAMPEAPLGGYPKGNFFGNYMGYRQSKGRQEFANCYNNAVDLKGPEVKALAALSRRTKASHDIKIPIFS
ncbi:hypothetical protein [Photorhabdus khanii]|uniref:CN hydrolase domain-containing protein n=1 Tax=Photorhabdus khanii subsp. guanajuatensis TaxID=2100166 RepID=A0A4R4JY46_9GAMM|nr:hypothetical protein [Photorhabdus khanii]TDB59082.1 hypothetical protein C5467_09490 [Photorhabdus khanii subsp. guanajuatensis]